MMEKLRTLARLGSEPIRQASADLRVLRERCGEETFGALQMLLTMKNGCYAFENALHVFPDFSTSRERGLVEWNGIGLWRQDYGAKIDDSTIFFAEDVFGTQFCLHHNSISTFDPETGSFESMATDMEEWAAKVLDDYNLWTGHGVAHDWQSCHGAIPIGHRLLPVIPFVFGGEFAVDNVRAVDSVEGMKYRAAVAQQIQDIPDGTAIRIKTTD